MILLGIDPGLRKTGWGVINVDGNRLKHVANGVIATNNKLPLPKRLLQIYEGLKQVIEIHNPIEAAVEETFVNKNPASTLLLGQARGIALLVPANAGLDVAEYSANLIKKTVVGSGHAAKQQIKMMVGTLLPGCAIDSEDAADALAVAICHAHHRETAKRIEAAQTKEIHMAEARQ